MISGFGNTKINWQLKYVNHVTVNSVFFFNLSISIPQAEHPCYERRIYRSTWYVLLKHISRLASL